MKPTDESPLLLVDSVQSLNYDGPDGGEVFADAGTRLDLFTGDLVSTGLVLDGVTGDLQVRGDIEATSFTLLDADGVTPVGELGQYVASDLSNSTALYMRSNVVGLVDGFLGWTDDPTSPEPRVFLTGPHPSAVINDHARVVLTELVGQLVGSKSAADSVTIMTCGTGGGTTWADRLEAYMGAYRNGTDATLQVFVADTGTTFVRNCVIDADNFSVNSYGTVTTGGALTVGGTSYLSETLTVNGDGGDITMGDTTFANWSGIEGANGHVLLRHDTSTPMYVRAASGRDLYVGGNNSNHMHFDSTDVELTVALAATAGTAALPGLCFNGDRDTGFYSYGTNDIGVALGGSVGAIFFGTVNGDERLRLYHDNANEGCYISFYTDGAATPSRIGFVGFPGSDDLWVKNEDSNGNMYLACDTTGRVYVRNDRPPYAQMGDGTNKGNLFAMTYADEATTGSNALTTSGVSPSGVRYSQSGLSVDAKCIVVGTADFECTTAGVGACVMQLIVAGVGEPDQGIYVPTVAGDRSTITKWWFVDLPVGSTEFQLKFSKTISAGAAQVNQQHTILKTIVLR